jgi:hypothetical protein
MLATLLFLLVISLNLTLIYPVLVFMDNIVSNSPFRNWKVLYWNIRGINSDAKRVCLKSKIIECNCDVLFFQETKREFFDIGFLKSFCPKSQDCFEFHPSVGATGGTIIVWNGSRFVGDKIFENDYALSVEFRSIHTGASWVITNVYVPYMTQGKLDFLNWFKKVQMPDGICRYPEDQVPPRTSSRSRQKARHANHTPLRVVNLSMNCMAQASSGTATCPADPAPAARPGAAPGPPRVLRTQLPLTSPGQLRGRHVSCGLNSRCPAWGSSGAATCPAASAPIAQPEAAPGLPRVLRPQLPLPSSGQLRGRHVCPGGPMVGVLLK